MNRPSEWAEQNRLGGLRRFAIAISVLNPKPELSTDPLYVRDEKTRGILRWDVTIDPKQNGEKALTIDYEFKMELDKNVNIGGFLAR